MDNDTWGLGDWSLVDTSEVGMLSAAQDAISREEAIVWVGWTPHWMNLELPMRYLEDPENLFGENNGESDVRTLLRSDYADAHPALVTFFEQFNFTAEEQSWMIQAFGQEERDLTEVAQHYSDMDDRPAVGHREELLFPLYWTDEDIAQIVAFLESLEGQPLDASLTAQPASPVYGE